MEVSARHLAGATPPGLPISGAHEPAAVCLERIVAQNDVLRAVIALDHDGACRAALESADRWRRGRPRSAIDGAPVLVKANIAVAGLPWHAGIKAYGDRIAAEDSLAVTRLRGAGAVILGLTNMDEGALGAAGDNPWLGRVGNPLFPGSSAGGSSGGSAAAVAAGFCAIALSTDTIGSVAIPAASCGVVGHRAGRDLLPLAGVISLSPSYDHLGWHVRTTADALVLRSALGAIAWPERPLRLATLALHEFDLEPAVAAAATAAAEAAREAGWTVDPIALPVAPAVLARRLFEVAEADAAAQHGPNLGAWPDGFSPAFRRLLAWGAETGTSRRAGHLAALQEASATCRAVLRDYDALLMPATPSSGFAVGSPVPSNKAVFAALPACLGWPATTVPAGDGAAVLTTAPCDELCLSIAHTLSAALR